MSPKIYLNTLRIGVYLSLITIFFVFRNLLFPYITSKQISFNILMEILFIFWLAFIIKYPEYRPKKSFITFGLLAFFAAIFVSSIFGVDFNLSFWGDIERMLGVFHLLHFLILYFIVITVFRDYRDWRILFIVSTIFAIGISLYGLSGEAFSTIGNTAYVSAYLLFNMFFCALLFAKDKGWWRWLYLIPLPFYLFEFHKADTTGALVGLGVSVILMLFLYGIFSRKLSVKIGTISVSAVIIILVMVVFTHRDAPWVVNNSLLYSVSMVNFQKNTFQTRLISWKAALKDFKNHPILGTGYGNFAIIFDKYFDPTFYNYTRSETYFDRAHNNVIDITSTAGLLGGITYLSIIGAAFFYLIIGFKRKKMSSHEFIIIFCLLTAYFVQNLVVFDSLVTYIMLMVTLAYIYWLSAVQGEVLAARSEPLVNKEIISLATTAVVMLTIMWQYNIKVFQMLDLTIAGQVAFAQNDVVGGVGKYKEALSLNTPLDRDSITSMNRMFVSPSLLKNVDKIKAKEIMDYNIETSKQVVAYNPHDSMDQMILAQVLDSAAVVNADVQEKFTFYSDQALDAIDKSIAASPGRIPIYYEKAQILINRGEKDKALETMVYAYNLNTEYYDSSCHLSNLEFYYKDEAAGYKYAEKCLDLGGGNTLGSTDQLKALVNHYSSLKDTKRMIEASEAIRDLNDKDVKNFINLAVLYAQTNQKDKAIEAVNNAIALDPTIKQYADEFISNLK